MNHISNIARSEGDPKVLQSGHSSLAASDRLARALGWYSIGLGLTELAMPGRICRSLGMEGQEGLVRAYGVRELAHGVLTLSPDRHVGLWSRVAGDALDIATLVNAMRSHNPKRDNAGLALAAVLGVTLLDIVGAQGVTSRHSRGRGQRRSYRNRSGFPQGDRAARGAAKDFEVPPDMRAAPVLASVSDRPAHARARPQGASTP